jgi:exodeoxyribonuclease-5
MTRPYFEEALALELALEKAGCFEYFIEEENPTLLQLVNVFALNYFTMGGSLLPVPQYFGLPSPASEESMSQPQVLKVLDLIHPPLPPAVQALEKSEPELELLHHTNGRLILSKDQSDAWAKLKIWVHNSEPYFVLRGYAGTGKTTLLQLLNGLKVKVYYSAPTNKAAKVLGKAVGGITAKTTYSILGIRMEQQEDKLVLSQGKDVPYFPRNAILVIDESSMCGTELCNIIQKIRASSGMKILIVGDPMQLPPVGEVRSPAWSFTKKEECKAILKQVMRYDNELLILATALRACIKNKDWTSPLKSNHKETGIWKYKDADQFERAILKAGSTSKDFVDTKVIAWRNKTVNYYNKIIRRHLGFEEEYCINDVVLLAEPYEEEGTLLAHTDDEFIVVGITMSSVTVDMQNIPVWSLHVKGDKSLTLNVPVDQSEVDMILGQKASFAKKKSGTFRTIAWKDFWATKAKFNRIRYGYALTAHRAQGSTYTGTVFVDQQDILCNHNKVEAFRCLYVACTRATTNLVSY